MAKYNEAKAARGRRAKAEVERRVTAALDRIDVAIQGEASGATLAQLLHGMHYLERGWADGEGQRRIPDDAPDFRVDQETAQAIAGGIAWMLTWARNARGTWGERE